MSESKHQEADPVSETYRSFLKETDGDKVAAAILTATLRIEDELRELRIQFRDETSHVKIEGCITAYPE